MLNVNLGCSSDLRQDSLNVDVASLEEMINRHADRGNWEPQYLQADLSRPWPWQDSTIDRIFAHDFFEHVDNLDYRGNRGAIFCMNEAHRVLKPGGILDLVVPCLDLEGKGIAPGCDPTHVQTWLGDWRYYFDEAFNHPKGERGRMGADYGITALFRTVGGRSQSKGLEKWQPVKYGSDPNRHKLFLLLECVK